ncbi:MAG: sugar phosphate isomerase/epimerase [Bacteroidales bacterium]|nr:sugar phosphate isomerase/epimerase [Bacteroidales bacterium]
MEIKFFCPHWGSKHLDLKLFLEKVKNAGYDGVEMSLPLGPKEKKEILEMLGHYDLQLVAQHWETLTGDFDAHKEEYRQRVENLASARPLLVNSQTGKDYFSFEQNAELIKIAAEISQKYNIKIIHETHRGKFSFAAHVAAGYLKRIPTLRLTIDLSHWCAVAESYLDDQQDAVKLVLSRADHIHARVGFPEGPQIPDPRVPEWKEALDTHVGWWNEVVRRKQKEGESSFTITPEFGPFPYMPVLPFTRQPITDQWEVNVYMMNYLKSALNA